MPIVSVVALRDFVYRGRRVERGTLFTMQAVDAAIAHRRGEVTLTRGGVKKKKTPSAAPPPAPPPVVDAPEPSEPVSAEITATPDSELAPTVEPVDEPEPTVEPDPPPVLSPPADEPIEIPRRRARRRRDE